MKKKLFNRIPVFALLFMSFTNFQCKKESTDKFCEVQRSTYLTVSNKEGMIGYYTKYNRWAVYTKVNTSNNIDSRIIGLVCDIPSSLKIDGLAVTFTGNYKNFNNDEKITPQMGGDELYYLDISNIQKK